MAHAARDLRARWAKMESALPARQRPGAWMTCRDRGRLGHRANARMGEFGAYLLEEQVDPMGAADRAERRQAIHEGAAGEARLGAERKRAHHVEAAADA